MVLDEPSSNLDMAAIDDLRQVLSLWKKQGKTILIAEHRLYYLHDLADRVLYVKDGEIEREYTPAEFDSLSDGIRKEMGLRPFSLSKLKPANQYQANCLLEKRLPLSVRMALENLLWPAVFADWKRSVAFCRLRGKPLIGKPGSNIATW